MLAELAVVGTAVGARAGAMREGVVGTAVGARAGAMREGVVGTGT